MKASIVKTSARNGSKEPRRISGHDVHIGSVRDALRPHYEIRCLIGEGGMARVYLAHDLRHDRNVAIKVMKTDQCLGDSARRFAREIYITAKINHPCVVPLFDSGDAEGQLYYVMPFMDGPTLGERLVRNGNLSVNEVVKIACEIGSALDYIHSCGFLHRDVTPANIFLPSARALICDFGIARAVNVKRSDPLATSGSGLGTPGYISPEQFFGGRDVDARSDQYALACLVFEMLVGETPFPGISAGAIHRKQLEGAPPILREIRPDVPEDVDLATYIALSYEPKDRFASVYEYVQILESAVHVGCKSSAVAPRPRASCAPDKSLCRTDRGARSGFSYGGSRVGSRWGLRGSSNGRRVLRTNALARSTKALVLVVFLVCAIALALAGVVKAAEQLPLIPQSNGEHETIESRRLGNAGLVLVCGLVVRYEC